LYRFSFLFLSRAHTHKYMFTLSLSLCLSLLFALSLAGSVRGHGEHVPLLTDNYNARRAHDFVTWVNCSESIFWLILWDFDSQFFFPEITSQSTPTHSYPFTHTSWLEFSVIIHWWYEPFGTHTLKVVYHRAARVPTTARRGLKYWGKHFPDFETISSQFAWVDGNCPSHRHLQGVETLCRVPLLTTCETRDILIHTIHPPLDHKRMLTIVEARTLVIFPFTELHLELILATCYNPGPC